MMLMIILTLLILTANAALAVFTVTKVLPREDKFEKPKSYKKQSVKATNDPSAEILKKIDNYNGGIYEDQE